MTIFAVHSSKRLRYGCATTWKTLSILAILLIVVLASAPIPALTAPDSKAKLAGARQDTHTTKDATRTALPVTDKQDPGGATYENDQEEASGQAPPNIHIVAPPAPTTVQWSLHEQILWAANLVLVILGYAGTIIALRILRQIKSQAQLVEATAQAAKEAAQAACMNAQAVLNAQRPWLLITVGPSPEGPGHFRILATNRGKYPAELISTSDRIGIVLDESCLPEKPEYSKKESDDLPDPILVMPGESVPIQTFARADLKWICRTEESFQRVQQQLDSIFLFGKVVYRNVGASQAKPNYETGWCCQYIHNATASDVILAGPAQYRKCT